MEDKRTTLVLIADDIQKVLETVGVDSIMDQLIEDLYNAFVEFSEEDSIMAIRSGYNYNTPVEGLIEWMPIRNVQDENMYIKMVGYHPTNPTLNNLPTIISNIAKYDTTSGHLIALMDGVLPTALRTGAASAVASKLFGYAESKTLGIIGCGAQSITQLHALSRVFELDTVLYYDIDQTTMRSFEERCSVLNLTIKLEAMTINEIVEKSDIISTATSIGVGDGPLFEYNKSKDWLHINAVGSDFAGKTELPKSLLHKSYVSPDLLEQAVVEGEIQQLEPNQIGDDLITCLKNANAITHLKNELTVFDSTGMSLEDQVVADVFLKYAKAMGLGLNIQLENIDSEQKHPYSFLKKLKTQQ